VRLVVALWLVTGNALAQQPCNERKLAQLERRLKNPRPENYAIAAIGLADACGSSLPEGFEDVLRTYARSPDRPTRLIWRELMLQGLGASALRLDCRVITPQERYDTWRALFAPSHVGPRERWPAIEKLPQAEDTYGKPTGSVTLKAEPVRTTVGFFPGREGELRAFRIFDRCGMEAVATREEAGGNGVQFATPGLQLAAAMVSVLDGVPTMRRRIILRALAGLDSPHSDTPRR
jgi:hypothetical protein